VVALFLLEWMLTIGVGQVLKLKGKKLEMSNKEGVVLFWSGLLESMRCTIGLVLFIAFVLLSTGCGKDNEQESMASVVPLSSPEHRDVSNGVSVVPDEDARTDIFLAGVVAELEEAQWPRRTAEKIVSTNADYFSINLENDPTTLKREIVLLKGLGKYPSIFPNLDKNPEISGLLAVSNDPEYLAGSFGDLGESELNVVKSLYMLHPSMEEIDLLANALKDNKSQIIKLILRGFIGVETLFMFDRGEESGGAYKQWLIDALNRRLPSDDEELQSFLLFLAEQGENIRERMAANPEFLCDFNVKLWPKLERLTNITGNTFEFFFDSEHLWDILNIPEGELLVERWGPSVPSMMLYGELSQGIAPYPADLHGVVIQTLLKGDSQTLTALANFQDEPLFHNFIRRSMSVSVRASLINKLLAAGPNYPDRLGYYMGLPNDALEKEAGPAPSGPVTWVPGYDLYNLASKMMDGREYSGFEVFMAGVDAISFVPTIKSVAVIGKGGLQATLKTGVKTTLKGGKAGIKDAFSDAFWKLGRERAAQTLGKKAAQELGERQLLKYGANSVMARAVAVTRAALNAGPTLDITKPLKFVYSRTKIGNKAFKRLTGLDARVFMRNDAKVVLVFNKTIPGLVATGFMRETAESLVVGAAANTDTGQSIIKKGYQTFRKAGTKVDEWQKHASAWWLMNASGQVEITDQK